MASRTFVAFLLAALLAGVPHAAAQEDELSRNGTGTVAVAATGQQDGVAAIGLTLQLADPSALQISSSLRNGTNVAVEHTVAWTIDGQAAGTTSRTGAATTPSVAAGERNVQATLHVLSAPAGSYTLLLAARKAGEGTTGGSEIVPVQVTRTNQPPSQVLGLTATSQGNTSIQLAWNATTDPDGDAVQYLVKRSNATVENFHVTTVAGLSFLDEGLARGVTYAYRVVAVDGAGTQATPSAQASATTPLPPDTAAPSAVADLRVTKATPASLALDWQPASDDRIGQLSYGVFLDGALAKTTTDTSATIGGLQSGRSYAIGVKASDAAGNVGPWVNITASTETTPPSPPATPAPSPGPPPGPPADTPSSSSSETSTQSTSSTQTSSTTATQPSSQSSSSAPGEASSTTATDNPPGRPETPGEQGQQQPQVSSMKVKQADGGVEFELATDEPASLVIELILLDGSVRRIEIPAGVDFRTGLGDLAPGAYRYSIIATDSDGNEGRLEGSFAVFERSASSGTGAGAAVVQTAVEAGLVQSIAQLAHIPVVAGSLFFLDDTGSGLVSEVRDATGVLEQRHGAVDAQVFLLQAGDNLVLLDARTQQAMPVIPLEGDVEEVVETEATTVAKVTVTQKEGWIVVTVPDPAPGAPILGLQRNGETLPVEFAWREGGAVSFLDDPSYTYSLTFDAASAGSTHDGPDAPLKASKGPFTMVGLVAMAMVVSIVALAIVLRRK